MTTSDARTARTILRDDPAEGVGFGLEHVNEVLAGMVGEVVADRPRDAELITCRLGLDGESPETLTLLGARFGVSRDRARQLYTRAVGTMLRQQSATGHHDLGVFAERYPVGWGDERLVRTLLAETYATDGDIAAQDWAYLKLRLAGHDLQGSKRLAGFVFQRIAGWQQKGRWHPLPAPEADAPDDMWNTWLRRVEWADGAPEELPVLPAGRLDYDDDSRGRMHSEKLGREVTFDTALQARLLRLLDASPRVASFRELPAAVTYELDGTDRVHYPTAAAQFTDGRIALIDVLPLAHAALHPQRARAAAGRAHAFSRGWGWLTWTGSHDGIPELLSRKVNPYYESTLTSRLSSGPMTWPALDAYRTETGLELLDLAALVLRHHWHWHRGPFRLTS
ncbi:hypothetical protein [Nocardia aurantiaca]|uniref:RNA polymerase sigma-70 region 4 domain-containing protein n=1 Tax=Nocardia aurantiaca TaxID=2675850 RepID=A0A6I3KW06_9NOCA|nr:hypothetical protein [Nocardia aurantiaca]MTE13767.1 hypothetical protein [Nocardia aurantiaca]